MDNKKPIVVVVSGGFDPIHSGHVRMFKEAKALGDKLIAVLNNDHWLMKKKKFVFMPQDQRKEVLEAIRYIDEVVCTRHPKDPEDMGVSEALIRIKPDIFANGGDRHNKDAHDPCSSLFKDMQTCQKLGIKMIYNVGEGGKIESSSKLVDKAMRNAPQKVDIRIKGKR